MQKTNEKKDKTVQAIHGHLHSSVAMFAVAAAVAATSIEIPPSSLSSIIFILIQTL